MFTYCFNNDFICIFISLLCILYFMMTNAATRISRFRTIKFYCIVLYLIFIQCNCSVATSYEQPILTLLIFNNGRIIIYVPNYFEGCIVWNENDCEFLFYILL